ncbi:MAG: diguanylate cyclase domain-containing protein [Candidatus Limnocylindrales bacterium]
MAGSPAAPVPVAPETLQEALDALLHDYPDAQLAAIGEDGLFVPPPAAFQAGTHRVLAARTMLELVVPEERELVLSTWERTRRLGAATVQVHLRADPAEAAVLHFLDLRSRHGTYLAVLVGAGGVRLPDLSAIPPLPPRVARVRKNELAVYVAVDTATTQLLGWSADALVGRRSLDFIHPDDQERAVQSWIEMLSQPERPQPPVRFRHRRVDGGWAWFEVRNQNRLADPAEAAVLSEMVDISEELAVQDALAAREQLLQRLAEALPLGVVEVRLDRRTGYSNGRLHQLLGGVPACDIEAQFAGVAREDWPALERALAAVLDAGIDADLEVWVRPPEAGGLRRCRLRLRALRDPAGGLTGAVVTVEDVTESVALRAELERRATCDVLTQLRNRASVLASLEEALADPGPGGTAVVFLDLDGFKGVNDRLGHLAGDALLRMAAERLVQSVRATDPVGRLGGDEFLVVCPQVGGPARALAVAERIAEGLRAPVRLDGITLTLRASLGVAYTRRPVPADRLVRRADAAMYASKRAGAGRPVLAGRVRVAGVRLGTLPRLAPGAP